MSTSRIDLRPPPALAIGVVGHGGAGVDDEKAKSVAAAFEGLLREIDALFRKIVAAERPFFADAEPVVRVVGTAAEGGPLLAARGLGAEIACILPFAPEEYEQPAARDLARTIVNAAQSVFVLPGRPGEGARADERANNVVLANIDLLLAVWNGTRVDGRAGTGDVVQAAVSFGIPVIVIPLPSPPPLAGEGGVGAHASRKLLLSPGDDRLEHPIATDLTGAPLEDLPRLLRDIVAPPAGSDKRKGLADLYDEQPGRRARRFEYPLLLKMFAVDRVQVRSTVARSQETSEPAPAPAIAELRLRTRVIDDFSINYGRQFRSSNASAFLLIIFAALFSATLMILFNVFGIWIFGQMLVTGLVLLDAKVGANRRWHQRWLDYRLIAERLRCLRFLHPLGLGLDRATGLPWRPKQSWDEWYVRRSERALGPPAGEIRPEHVADAARRLADVEIAGQIDYHRRAFRQLGLLEQRLARIARWALLATTAVAALLGLVELVEWPLDPWRPLASLLLFALPAVTSAFAGVRADADLVRLTERSAAAAAALARLRRVIGAAAPTYDRIAVAAMRAAAIMAAELSDWRFVLERRRARSRRPGMGKK
jgi:hypothetical protein